MARPKPAQLDSVPRNSLAENPSLRTKPDPLRSADTLRVFRPVTLVVFYPNLRLCRLTAVFLFLLCDTNLHHRAINPGGSRERVDPARLRGYHRAHHDPQEPELLRSRVLLGERGGGAARRGAQAQRTRATGGRGRGGGGEHPRGNGTDFSLFLFWKVTNLLHVPGRWEGLLTPPPPAGFYPVWLICLSLTTERVHVYLVACALFSWRFADSLCWWNEVSRES